MLTTVWHKFKQIDYKYHLICGFLMRIIVIYYGKYHDGNFPVPFTDVDYKVFTDAARHVLNYTSPYNRHTYRYTPFVAILLTPNIFLHDCFGKLLFSIIDCVVAFLIRLIVKNALKDFERYEHKQEKKFFENKVKHLEEKQGGKQRRQRRKNKNMEVRKTDLDVQSDLAMLFWLYNPMTVTIATRGNCDSIAGLLVISTIYLLQCKRQPFYAGIVHGLAIHVRLYPIAYSLAFFMYLSKYSFYSLSFRNKTIKSVKDTKNRELESEVRNKQTKALKKQKKTNESSRALKQTEQSLVAFEEKKVNTIFKKEYLFYMIPNLQQVKLILGCFFSLSFLTGLFYFFYGYEFLYETYIYHLIRRDARHNFSLYFYLQYLTLGIKNIGYWQKILTTLPQVLLLLVLSIRYGLNKLTLNFAILTITIVMVSYNTVLTSQYFVWILVALSLCLWQIRMSKLMCFVLIVVWVTAQAAWLLPAYLLEFHGHNTFMYIWTQSVSFFCANMAILGRIINNFMPINSYTKKIV